MGKKNSGEPAKTRIRSPKSSGKPSGRGFIGHRARGQGRSCHSAFAEQVGTDERPDSVVDEDNDECDKKESSDSSEGVFEAQVHVFHYSPDHRIKSKAGC